MCFMLGDSMYRHTFVYVYFYFHFDLLHFLKATLRLFEEVYHFGETYDLICQPNHLTKF